MCASIGASSLRLRPPPTYRHWTVQNAMVMLRLGPRRQTFLFVQVFGKSHGETIQKGKTNLVPTLFVSAMMNAATIFCVWWYVQVLLRTWGCWRWRFTTLIRCWRRSSWCCGNRRSTPNWEATENTPTSQWIPDVRNSTSFSGWHCVQLAVTAMCQELNLSVISSHSTC